MPLLRSALVGKHLDQIAQALNLTVFVIFPVCPGFGSQEMDCGMESSILISVFGGSY